MRREADRPPGPVRASTPTATGRPATRRAPSPTAAADQPGRTEHPAPRQDTQRFHRPNRPRLGRGTGTSPSSHHHGVGLKGKQSTEQGSLALGNYTSQQLTGQRGSIKENKQNGMKRRQRRQHHAGNAAPTRGSGKRGARDTDAGGREGEAGGAPDEASGAGRLRQTTGRQALWGNRRQGAQDSLHDS